MRIRVTKVNDSYLVPLAQAQRYVISRDGVGITVGE